MSATVFYFSGTGNSLSAAHSIAEKLGSSKVIALVSLPEKPQTVVDTDTAVFVFPVYAGGPPLVVLNSLSRIRFVGAPYICAVSTCDSYAGTTAGILARRLEKDTGHKLAASWTVFMPGNYTPLSEAPEDSEISRKLAQADLRLGQIAAEIGQKMPGDPAGILEKFHWLVEFPWYGFAMGVARSDRRFRASADCTGCGICARVCPVRNIVNNQAGRPVWQHHCEQCMACLQFCPVEAVQFCWWTRGRRRYHHPQVSAEMIEAQKKPARS